MQRIHIQTKIEDAELAETIFTVARNNGYTGSPKEDFDFENQDWYCIDGWNEFEGNTIKIAHYETVSLKQFVSVLMSNKQFTLKRYKKDED